MQVLRVVKGPLSVPHSSAKLPGGHQSGTKMEDLPRGNPPDLSEQGQPNTTPRTKTPARYRCPPETQIQPTGAVSVPVFGLTSAPIAKPSKSYFPL